MDWQRLTGGDFETVVYHLLGQLDFQDVQRQGGSGDGGADLTASTPVSPAGFESSRFNWVFQCKNTRRIDQHAITKELTKARGLDLDVWVLATTANPSPGLRRWLKGIEKNREYRFRIEIWWRDDLERLVQQNAPALRPLLSEAIIRHLGLEQPESEVSSHGVLSTFRDHVNSQIETFARAKYIPRLYTARKIEASLAPFFEPEGRVALELKHALRKQLRRCETALAAWLAAHQTAINESLSQLLEAIEALHAKHEKASPSQQVRLDREVAGLRMRQSKLVQRSVEVPERVGVCRRQLEELSEAIDRLPEGLYWTEHTRYGALRESIRLALKEAASLEGFDEREEVTGASLHLYENLLDQLIEKTERPFQPCIAVVDRAGGGKTNVACHLALTCVATMPTILIFGKEHIDGSHGIIRYVQRVVAEVFASDEQGGMRTLDRFLMDTQGFLYVIIDGINENRNIEVLDVALAQFFHWVRGHRIKVLITCRDIYWNFFHPESWPAAVGSVLRRSLNEFTDEEYPVVLKRYFSYFRISCELRGEAYDACRHPLLLRFFCEAYGTIRGNPIKLGKVHHIRLKELFDKYMQRKAEDIRLSLGRHTPSPIVDYLLSLAEYMLERSTSTISEPEIAQVTGVKDTSTRDSIYLRLLDEDIILEEQSGTNARLGRISFVYDAFMEYLAARAFLAEQRSSHGRTAKEIADTLTGALGRWTNARGVAEFVAFMLSDEQYGRSPGECRAFLEHLSLTPEWKPSFWAIVGRLPGIADQALFDCFPRMVCDETRGLVEDALTRQATQDIALAGRTAQGVLLSACLPPVLQWRDLHCLSQPGSNSARQLISTLTAALTAGVRIAAPVSQSRAQYLRVVFPFLPAEVQERFSFEAQYYGVNLANLQNEVDLFLTLWRVSAEYQPMLINGLFDHNDHIRAICADRIRFLDAPSATLTELCAELRRVESDTRIRNILDSSWRHLHRRSL